jgi:hypothetical protein
LWGEAIKGFKFLREAASIMRELPTVRKNFDSDSWFKEAGNMQVPGMNPGGWLCLIDVIIAAWTDDHLIGTTIDKESVESENQSLTEIVEADRLAKEGLIPQTNLSCQTRPKVRAVARVLSAIFTATLLFDEMREIAANVGVSHYPPEDGSSSCGKPWDLMKRMRIPTTRPSMAL